MATRDLSVQAILSANTTPFANGMKSASDAAKRFSSDMKRIRQEISQPLYVPKPGQKENPFVMLGGTISEGLQVQRFRQIQRIERMALHERKQAIAAEQKVHNDRFEMIRRSEEKALKLRRFYARKEAELDAARGGFRFSGGVLKKGLGAAGLAAGMIGESFGDSTTGRIGSAIGNIGGQTASGFLVGGPWGAAIFGGVAALNEFKTAVDSASKNLREATAWAAQQVAMRTGNVVGAGASRLAEVRGLREGAFPTLRTEADVRRDIVERARDARNALEFAQTPGSGFSSVQIEQLRRQRSLILGERIAFDQAKAFRDTGAQGLQALFQSRGAIADTAMQFGRQGFGALSGGIGRIREGLFEGRRLRELAARESLISRVQSLMGMTNTSPPLAARGSNEYLRAISDQPKAEKDIGELVKIAKEQLAEEKKQREAIEKIVIANVTVSM